MTNSTALQSSFTGGLKTEFTGLNFPENACTAMDNCVVSLIGEIQRREGVNFEANDTLQTINSSSVAVTSYLWTNAGGDGLTQIMVVQSGNTLYFFNSSAVTTTSPLSTQLLGSTVTVNTFQAMGNSATVSQVECQFSSGNGYLFVYHPDCDPFYCTYSSGTVVANVITLQIRDFSGLSETALQGANIAIRPNTLSAEHQYNLQNQGWVANPSLTFGATACTSTQGPSTFNTTVNTSTTFTVTSGLSLSNGQQLNITGTGQLASNGQFGSFSETVTITGYTGTSLTVFLPAGGNGSYFVINAFNMPSIVISTINTGQIGTWKTDIGNYPSNADIWWEFKDVNDLFNPTTTIGNVSLGAGQAPQGHYILNAFTQQRTAASGVTSLTDISTTLRPQTGAWFQGRVWYSGVNASQAATGDGLFYTWTENLYFSQIVTNVADFGTCYQTNDPTDEDLNALLPTDGGVITIQGCGGINKLFALQNGLLVFATNGIWLIAGSGGLGFAANAYSSNKIASVQSLTPYSFVDVLGTPMFWNEEGIYAVMPDQNASPYQLSGFKVEPLTVGTILSFYNAIPKDSKKYARGTYNPIDYTIEWIYKANQEVGISDRYHFDSILFLNMYNKAFYPYTVAHNSACRISGVQYVVYPNSLNTPDPVTKYLTTVNNTGVTFSEENDSTTWRDWFSYDGIGVDYTSFFTTGYNLHGKGLMKWANTYVYLYADNTVPYSYVIQGIWDYAGSGNSGRYTQPQIVANYNPNFSKIFRRHKIRGHGMSLQLNISSVSGQPFTFFGWGMHDDIDASI